MMAASDDYPRTILDGRTYEAVWQSPHELVIRSKRQWWMIALGVVVLAVLGLGLLVSSIALSAELFIAQRFNWLGLMCFIPFGLSFLAMFCLFSFILAQWTLARVVTFDLGRQMVEIRHIPPFRKEFELGSVRSVELLLIRDNAGAACHLCVSVAPSESLRWIVSAYGYRSADYYLNELLPLARLLARAAGCPLSWSWQRVALLRIAKSPQSHEISVDDEDRTIAEQ